MSDPNQTIRIVSPAGQRIDGIDLAQLLRDLREANAGAGPGDLFRLCVDAQRVLSGLCSAVGTGAAARGEAEIMGVYRAMDDAAQEYVLEIARRQAKRNPRRRRPRLTLMQTGQQHDAAQDEVDLVSLCRSMDKAAQELTLATARTRERLWPKERPRLTLVQSGKHLQGASHG
jgi:hypothetical protein